MLFNSIEFLFFFPLVAAIYFVFPKKYRWVLLLSASYYFYMSWKKEYILLIMFSTVVDYLCGLGIYNFQNKKLKKVFLSTSLVLNLGLLFYFKYYNFFILEASNFLQGFGLGSSLHTLNIILPVGISFYTFQTLSYSIDIYKGKLKPERHFGIFALFVSFFPQLVAGPIERAKNLLPQLKKSHLFNSKRVSYGLKLIMWGMFKKVVIADRLAEYVNSIYGNSNDFSGIGISLGTLFFAFQIYCDFSGYSDIAIGSSRILGIKLMDNFRTPYFASSISEFWSRWHISLSTWFRDYVYIPLGGNKVSKGRALFNIALVFLVSGIWHGANWTFLAWGLFHGFCLIAERISKVKLNHTIGSIKTFLLVCLGWVFFRAESIDHSFLMIKKIVSFQGTFEFGKFISLLNVSVVEFNLAITLLFILVLLDYIHYKKNLFTLLKRVYIVPRYVMYAVLLSSIIFFGAFGKTTFIYFQF